MNILSYISLAKQSLVRYDKANQMLRWASDGMSDTQLSKYNFRRLKKLLENKGWVYERNYPFKGKALCTVSLLDIVIEGDVESFNNKHCDESGNLKISKLASSLSETIQVTKKEVNGVTHSPYLYGDPDVKFGMKSLLARIPELELGEVQVYINSDADIPPELRKKFLETTHKHLQSSAPFKKMLKDIGDKHGIELRLIDKVDPE